MQCICQKCQHPGQFWWAKGVGGFGLPVGGLGMGSRGKQGHGATACPKPGFGACTHKNLVQLPKMRMPSGFLVWQSIWSLHNSRGPPPGGTHVPRLGCEYLQQPKLDFEACTHKNAVQLPKMLMASEFLVRQSIWSLHNSPG